MEDGGARGALAASGGACGGALRQRAQAGDEAADPRDGRPPVQARRHRRLRDRHRHGGCGLTNGAFYAHFASKQDLVATAVADQLRDQHASIGALAPDLAGVEQYVRAYLSVEHRDNPDDGCPSAALLDELGRCTDVVKRAYTDGLLVLIDDIAARLAPDDPPSARANTLGVFALMVGTLQLSRALADPQLADAVLEQGIHNALTLLGAEQQH